MVYKCVCTCFLFASAPAEKVYRDYPDKDKLAKYLDKNKKYYKGELLEIIKKLEREYFSRHLNISFDSKYFTDEIIPKLWEIYMKHRGSHSSEKTRYLHEFLQKYLEGKIFKKEDGYEVFMETRVKSYNLTGQKNCDIVVKKGGEEVFIIPTKIIMSNYKQNKGNYFENLTGELTHLVNKNPNLKIVPLNIFFSDTPYLTKGRIIKKFEKIEYKKDLNLYENLKNIMTGRMGEGEECRPLAHDVINYVIDVKHVCRVGQKFEEAPTNFRINDDTPFRTLEDIFNQILQEEAAEKKWVMTDAQEYKNKDRTIEAQAQEIEQLKKRLALTNQEK